MVLVEGVLSALFLVVLTFCLDLMFFVWFTDVWILMVVITYVWFAFDVGCGLMGNGLFMVTALDGFCGLSVCDLSFVGLVHFRGFGLLV